MDAADISREEDKGRCEGLLMSFHRKNSVIIDVQLDYDDAAIILSHAIGSCLVTVNAIDLGIVFLGVEIFLEKRARK